MLGSLAAFVAVSVVVICTPGQDTALTIRNTLSGGSESFVALAVLGLLFSLMGLAWLTLYAVVVAKAGQFLRGRVRRALDAVTGTVLVAFGIRRATER